MNMATIDLSQKNAAGVASAGSFQDMGLIGSTIAGFSIMVLFFGGFLGWAGLVPIGAAAIAPGIVSVESNRKTIQHLEGGIVGEIRVTAMRSRRAMS
jgi:multidrug efflux pump subunit AcrA (membrane-fusion protein)